MSLPEAGWWFGFVFTTIVLGPVIFRLPRKAAAFFLLLGAAHVASVALVGAATPAGIVATLAVSSRADAVLCVALGGGMAMIALSLLSCLNLFRRHD